MRLNSKKQLAALIAAAGLAVPLQVFATNGYFGIGYGSNARGMAGVGTALPKDSLAAATNPAGMGLVGNRADLGIELFSPSDRSATTQFGGLGPGSGTSRTQTSDNDLFAVPGFGYVRAIDDKTSVGVSVYGNGGMNTDYAPQSGANLFGYNDPLGVDLSQLIIAPTVTRKVAENHTVGASLLLGYQRFKAYGLQNFCSLKAGAVDGACSGFGGIGTATANAGLTNQGYDDAAGAGIRIGWVGQVSPTVTLGAAYSSKIYMSKLDKYNQLFAEQGDFDIPANASIGIAVKATPKLTVAADVQQIWYGDVKSIANHGPNTSDNANVFADGQGFLGQDNGLGFGWEDMTIIKLGIEYAYNSKWMFRGGFSYGESPIPDGELPFNVLAPAVIEKHLTLGFSYKPAANRELTVAYMHAFDNSQTGPWADAFGSTDGNTDEATLQMEQNALEVSYTWRFD